MKRIMNSKLVLVLVFTLLLIPITSFAQPMEFSVQNVRVSEKENYKVIFMDIRVTVKNLELSDWIPIAPIGTTLINENGKTHVPDPSECEIPLFLNIYGKTPSGYFHTCFSVEKEFNNFKVFFTPQYQQPILIGIIDLNQINQQTAQNTESIQNIPKTIQDFFSQLLNMVKSLFNFS